VCTLIALHQVHRHHPLIVVGNRDELYARRATGPQLLSAMPRVIGGRDEEKGGTWLGVSAHGFFVGLTNQRTAGPPEPGLRSRGEVVLAALRQPSLAAAVDGLLRLDAREYNSFNLLLGDARALWVAYARREAAPVEIAPLPPGIWTLPNDRLGSPDFPKIDRAAVLAAPLSSLPWPELVPAAQAMLADHQLVGGDARQALCVHTPHYGTVSATLLALSPRGVAHYLHADGPPCQAPLVDRAALVAALAR
jgi:uncharacterized protein with NRDE domain